MDTADFMRECERASRLLPDQVRELGAGATVYDRAHALFGIVERCTLTLDKTIFWEIYTAHCAGDRERFEELLNTALGVA